MGRVYDATFGRFFSSWYESAMRKVDEAGLRETRREVLAPASGRTLDIGTGTGSNIFLYPDEVTELVLAEPDQHMQRILQRTLEQRERPNTELVQAPAEELPFEDASFDYVACTMVLCTAPEPEQALVELARVTKPGGKLLFLEHVRSEDPYMARRQDRFEKPWRFIADGCHCNRDSLATIKASPFTLESFKRGHMPRSPLFMVPLVYGSAVLDNAR